MKVPFSTIARYLKFVWSIVKHGDYSSAIETAEVMDDTELMALLRQSIQEADEGKLVPWEDVKLELGLQTSKVLLEQETNNDKRSFI